MPNEIIFYKTLNREQRIEVVYRDENFWMTQTALADLFAVGIRAISKYLRKNGTPTVQAYHLTLIGVPIFLTFLHKRLLIRGRPK